MDQHNLLKPKDILKLDLSYDIPRPSENKNCQMEFKTNLRSFNTKSCLLFHNIIHQNINFFCKIFQKYSKKVVLNYMRSSDLVNTILIFSINSTVRRTWLALHWITTFFNIQNIGCQDHDIWDQIGLGCSKF